MKNLILVLAIVFSGMLAQAQADTIFTFSDYIVCIVKEIGDDEIKYTFPDEEFLITFKKSKVQKIVFKSGREMVFVESTNFKDVNGWEDYNKVSITTISHEVDGLYKMGEVSSLITGGTNYSSSSKLRIKAEKSLKIQAAMIGANIVYKHSDHTSAGKSVGTDFIVSTTANSSISGIAYSNRLLDIEEFKIKTNVSDELRLIKIVKMNYRDRSPSTNYVNNKKMSIKNYKIIDNSIIIEYKGKMLKLIAITDTQIILMEKTDKYVSNYVLLLGSYSL